MTYKTHHNRVSYLMELMEHGAASGPQELAKKFECSEKTIRRMVNELREEGMDISFCKKTHKYILKK